MEGTIWGTLKNLRPSRSWEVKNLNVPVEVNSDVSKVYRLAGRWKNKKLPPPPFIDLKIASGFAGGGRNSTSGFSSWLACTCLLEIELEVAPTRQLRLYRKVAVFRSFSTRGDFS